MNIEKQFIYFLNLYCQRKIHINTFFSTKNISNEIFLFRKRQRKRQRKRNNTKNEKVKF